MYWRMDEAGVRGPSRRKIKDDAPEVGGVSVLPGTYKIKITFGEHMDSSMIDVKYDPRVEIDRGVLEDQYKFQKQLEKERALAAAATQRIVEAKEIVDFYTKQMKEKTRSSLRKKSKIAKP